MNKEKFPKRNLPEALYDRYAPGFKTLSIRYCGNIADAEDVLHDGFIKIIQNLHKFKLKPDANFEGWMRRIIVNTALNHLRDNARENNFLDIDRVQEPMAIEQEDDGFFTTLATRINPDQVLEMVRRLPSKYRVVLNLYVFEEYSHREIAEMLKCSENTSKSQLYRARALFRKQVDEFLAEKKKINKTTHAIIG